jgi:hypothetical protein
MSAVRGAVDHTMIAVTSGCPRSLERVQRGAVRAAPVGTDVGGPA